MKYNSKVSNYKSRKRLYLVNILIATRMRITKKERDAKLWIFGCWGGNRYDDNSRYLYEYILNNHKEVKPVWITRNEDVFRKLKNKGLPVEMSNSVDGKNIMKRAGVVFYTNGLDDLSDFAYSYGAKLIHLSHAAAGIKKSGLEKNDYKGKKIKLLLKRIKDSLFDWYHFDINISTSEESKKSHACTYGKERMDKIKITGLPRNDLILNPELFSTSKPQYLDGKYRYILYMPTYRKYENKVVQDLLRDLIADENLMSELKSSGFKILIKLHEEDSGDFEGNDYIIALDKDIVTSTQELLLWSDVLITDYSSCCMDFALKNSTVLIYAPDYQEYNKFNGIMDLWMPIFNSNAVLKNSSSLSKTIICICRNIDVKQHDLSEWINSKYKDSTIDGTIYSENVIKEVNQLV